MLWQGVCNLTVLTKSQVVAACLSVFTRLDSLL